MGAGITVVGDPAVKNDNEITVSIKIDADADFSYARAVTITIDSVDVTAETKFTIKEKTT
jgi:hypothetical protein